MYGRGGWASVWVIVLQTADGASGLAETTAASFLWSWLSTEANASSPLLMAALPFAQVSREETESEIMGRCKRLEEITAKLSLFRKLLRPVHHGKMHRGSWEGVLRFGWLTVESNAFVLVSSDTWRVGTLCSIEKIKPEYNNGNSVTYRSRFHPPVIYLSVCLSVCLSKTFHSRSLRFSHWSGLWDPAEKKINHFMPKLLHIHSCREHPASFCWVYMPCACESILKFLHNFFPRQTETLQFLSSLLSHFNFPRLNASSNFRISCHLTLLSPLRGSS